MLGVRYRLQGQIWDKFYKKYMILFYETCN